MIATVANMRRCEAAKPVFRVVMLDTSTGEHFSATSGDYWQHAENEPLAGEDGEPMVLARVVPEHYVSIDESELTS